MTKPIATAILLWALAACTPGIAPPPAKDNAEMPRATVQPQANSPLFPKPQILNATVAQAVRDLALRLGVSPDQVQLIDAETVVWADSALGCPQPGAMYLQVLQEGMRIRLQVAGQIYQYHSSATRKPFLCQNPSEPAAVSPRVAPAKRDVTRPLDVQAIADLAARLNIAEKEIEVVRMQEVDWPDGSLGCPQPGRRYMQVVMNGTFIQLRVGDRTYNYHSANAQPPFLCISKDEVVPEDSPQE